MKAIHPCDFTTVVQLCTFKVIVVYDDGQNHLLFLFFHQVADVWLCDANEAGGPAEWRLFLHGLPVFWGHCLCHRPWYI